MNAIKKLEEANDILTDIVRVTECIRYNRSMTFNCIEKLTKVIDGLAGNTMSRICDVLEELKEGEINENDER